ncbi:MAG TPA: tRNA lysidine(34) synthetase TilS [Candidatus Acidoferrum sp.]|nr:tRNA lysidine(34) synthetase TilS [Candidatus Acidoferrum sp.]
MLAGGETVLVAVSGGADSVALLHLLLTLSPEFALSLHVLHVDHGLRPDSDRDAAFVRQLAARLGVPAEVARVTVPPDGSLEAAARAERYAALDAHARRVGADRIAVGHTVDDQAETVLMRMMAGAGVRGLAGIPAVRGRVIRPLIEARRTDLVTLLQAAGLSWIEDPSNRDPRFLRNRIRHELMPVLRASYRPDIVATLERIARLCRNTVEAIERVASRELDRLAIADDDAIVLAHDALAGLPAQVAAEVLRQAAGRLGSRAPLRAWAHRGLARVLASPPPRRAFRLGGVVVEVSSGRVRLAASERASLPARELTVPGTVELPEIGRVVQARVVTAADYVVPRVAVRVAFDASRLPSRLIVRARRPGDRFAPFGGQGERRLKTFLIDEKIPRWERARLPLVEADGRILWVGGVRRGDAAPVTPRTDRVVELLLIPLA